jgi:hypothetical protein
MINIFNVKFEHSIALMIKKKLEKNETTQFEILRQTKLIILNGKIYIG